MNHEMGKMIPEAREPFPRPRRGAAEWKKIFFKTAADLRGCGVEGEAIFVCSYM